MGPPIRGRGTGPRPAPTRRGRGIFPKINRGGSMTTALLNCGRKPDPGRKRQAEECSGRLTVRAWLDGDAPAGAGPLGLVVTRPHFGGERRWFACPGCRRRAGVLYRPDDGDP